MKVHFVGIGGVGMSAIAKVLIEKGWHVTGSDMTSSVATAELERMGAEIFIGHSAQNVVGATTVVRSSAVDDENPEIRGAREMGIPVLHRSDILAQLLNHGGGIAVAGAHGKTTITGMLGTVLETAGLDPTILVGGQLVGLGIRAKAGNGAYVVAEADESDQSFLRYFPHIAVVSKIEADHLENYNGSFANLVEAYRKFISQVDPDGFVVLHRQSADVLGDFPRNSITYGLDRMDCSYSAKATYVRDFTSEMEVFHGEHLLGTVRLKVPGRHNLENALAVVAVCNELGVAFSVICDGLAKFSGIKRRFQLVAEDPVRNILVVDDYAHHPTELKATLQAAKSGFSRRIVAVFQPHRFNRTKMLLDEFAEAFQNADELLLAPIYAPAPEKPIEGVSSEVLAERIALKTGRTVKVFHDLESIASWLQENMRDGDLILTLGAGDVWKVGLELADRIKSGLC